MELGARCFLFNEDEEILLVKHDATQPWVLPGGRVEDNETVYDCLERELKEEVGVDITILGVQNEVTAHNVSPLPVPISVFKVAYEHRERGDIEKLEHVFFARTMDEITEVDKDEVYDHRWISQDDFFELKADTEIHEFVQEILDQNIDLYELL